MFEKKQKGTIPMSSEEKVSIEIGDNGIHRINHNRKYSQACQIVLMGHIQGLKLGSNVKKLSKYLRN